MALIALVKFIGTLLKGYVLNNFWLNSRWWFLVLCTSLWGLWLWLVMSSWIYHLCGCCMAVLTPLHTPESRVTKLGTVDWKSRDFGFQVSASRLTAFHGLRLTGVWWGLAHSGWSQDKSLTKQAIEQAVTFSEYPLIFLSYSQARFEVHWPV